MGVNSSFDRKFYTEKHFKRTYVDKTDTWQNMTSYLIALGIDTFFRYRYFSIPRFDTKFRYQYFSIPDHDTLFKESILFDIQFRYQCQVSIPKYRYLSSILFYTFKIFEIFVGDFCMANYHFLNQNQSR